MRGLIEPVRLDGRTNLIPRSAVERYKAEHLGNGASVVQLPQRPSRTG